MTDVSTKQATPTHSARATPLVQDLRLFVLDRRDLRDGRGCNVKPIDSNPFKADDDDKKEHRNAKGNSPNTPQ